MEFSIVVPVYNERDVIEETIDRLLRQRLRVHVIDNWSDDGSYEAVQGLTGQKRETARLVGHADQMGKTGVHPFIFFLPGLLVGGTACVFSDGKIGHSKILKFNPNGQHAVFEPSFGLFAPLDLVFTPPPPV